LIRKGITLLCICLLSLGVLPSCGLEEFAYIDYIYDSRNEYNDTNAIIYLPDGDAEGYGSYFDNFIIFYRIYISGNNVQTGRQLEGQGTNIDRSSISATLNSDYNGLYNLTDITSTNVSTSNLETTFYNRRYFGITLENANVNSVLGSRALGSRLDIAFPPNPGEQPTLIVDGGTPYVFKRATEPPAGQTLIFSPQPPDRDFLNNSDLCDPAKAYPTSTNINVDTATNSGANLEYTYIAMYIAAKGTSNEMPPRNVYSQPTFIGIFRLANRS